MLENSLTYLLVLVSYLFLGFLEYRFPVYKRNIQFVECLFFIFFFGLRGYIGTDWINYYEYYTTKSIWNFTRYEPGFCLLTNLCSAINLSYNSWIFLIVVLQGFLFDFFFSKKIKYMYLAYIILISFFPNLIIDTLRNFISILIGLISLDKWANRHRAESLMLLLLSISFHSTGIVFALLLPMTRSYLSKKSVIVLFTIGLIIYFLRIEYIKPIISIMGNILPSSYSMMIDTYLTSEVASSSYGVSFGIIEKIFFFIVVMLKYDFITRSQILEKYIFNLFVLYILSQFYLSEMSILITRFAIIFFAGYLVSLASINYIYSIKSNRIILSCLLLFLCFIKTSISYSSKIYEYSNIIFAYENINERKYFVRQHYSI